MLNFLVLEERLKAPPSLWAGDEEDGFVDPAEELWRCVSVHHIKQNILNISLFLRFK